MKIEAKDCDWDRCKKGNKNTGNINYYWRYAHKKARVAWKEAMYRHDYDSLIKRV